MVNGVSVNLQANPFGNVQRIGMYNNGRVLYNVVDSDGQSAGKLTVPYHEADRFEAAYKDILESAPRIQQYVTTHSGEDNFGKRKALSQALITTGGVIGCAIPALLTKSKSTIKNIFKLGTGVITGMLTGFSAAYLATLPPGTLRFTHASRTIAKLDIQPVKEK